MIEDGQSVLFGRSTVRRRLLVLLFDRPEARFHLRGLARAAGASVGTTARELERLVRAGLVIRTAEGRQVYFQAAARSPLFEPLQALVRRTIAAPGVIRRFLEGLSGVESAVIFGSYARGELEPASDIDLLIIGKPDMDELTDRMEAAGRELARPVNYVVLRPEEFEARRRKGDRFVGSVLGGPLVPVVGHLGG